MRTDPAEARIRRECRKWLVLLRSDEVRASDRERFETWLERDPAHREAYEKLQDIWQEIGELRELAPLEPVPPMPAPARKRLALSVPPWALAASLAALVVLLTWIFVQPPPAGPVAANEPYEREYSTGIAQLREIDLPDGSRLTLGAHSRLGIEITGTRRLVHLASGEAFFAVAHDPSRPFEVRASAALVRVLGTEFEVAANAQRVQVAVAHGRVEVRAGGNDASRSVTMTAGQQLEVPNGAAPGAIRTLAPGEVAAWREGRLVYEDAALAEIVADLNRYRSEGIALDSSAIGELRVTAAFRASQSESFLANLPSVLPVRLEHDARGATLLRQATAATDD